MLTQTYAKNYKLLKIQWKDNYVNLVFLEINIWWILYNIVQRIMNFYLIENNVEVVDNHKMKL